MTPDHPTAREDNGMWFTMFAACLFAVLLTLCIVMAQRSDRHLEGRIRALEGASGIASPAPKDVPMWARPEPTP